MPTWNSAGDWDSALDQSGGYHESIPGTEHGDAGVLGHGYAFEEIPFSEGLVGWWPLNRSGGTVLDSSGNDNDGTAVGTSEGGPSIAGLTARYFDGSDDYIELPQLFTGINNTFTWGPVWIRPDSAADSRVFVHRADYADVLLRFNKNGNRQIEFVLWDTADNPYTMLSPSLELGEWTQVTGTYDGTTQRLFIDGVEVNSLTASVDIDWSDSYMSTFIGAEGPDGGGRSLGYFNGAVSSLRVYDRPLSPAEIQSLYQLGAGDYDPLMPGKTRYRLDGDATDLWGQNDGTVNGPTFVASEIGPPGSQAASFNGNGDYINLPDGVDDICDGSSDFSICYWTNSQDTGTLQMEVVLRDTSFVETTVLSGQHEISVTDINGAEHTASGSAVFGEWTHWAHIFENGGDLILYKNANEVGRTTHGATQIQSKGQRNRIGESTWGNTFPFWGEMADFRLYSRSLSAGDVQELYRRTRTGGTDMVDKLVRAR